MSHLKDQTIYSCTEVMLVFISLKIRNMFPASLRLADPALAVIIIGKTACNENKNYLRITVYMLSEGVTVRI
jgi:hypothetical protein